MGAYTDPYNEFGMLSNQGWRAIRLVLDTGIHSKKMDPRAGGRLFQGEQLGQRHRHRARGRSLHELAGAGDELHGRAARRSMNCAPGRLASWSKFDIKDFHEAVLSQGALPLDVLEAEVDRYIAAKKAA
ncbi:DUF885 family protein [Sphingomonas sp. MMS24-JH45]